MTDGPSDAREAAAHLERGDYPLPVCTCCGRRVKHASDGSILPISQDELDFLVSEFRLGNASTSSADGWLRCGGEG